MYDGQIIKNSIVPDQDRCSYCGLPNTSSVSFSYGFPGVPRIYKCNRWWRHLLPIINWKRFNLPFKVPIIYYKIKTIIRVK